MQFHKPVMLLLSFLMAGNLFSQRPLSLDEFDSVYHKSLKNIGHDNIAVAKDLEILSSSIGEHSPVQKAKINFLKLKLIQADNIKMEALEKNMFSAPDTLESIDSILYVSEKYLERSMPDRAVPLLLQAIEMAPEDSDKAIFGKINLCEAYRQKQEYYKGIALLKELLNGPKSISEENRAYAYNRLAAIYNEWGRPRASYIDSVYKYSMLCYEIAETMNSKSNMAASQNELSFQYILKNDYEKAIELSRKAVANFIEAGFPFNAMNALINQSIIYIGLKDYKNATSALETATDLSSIEENRNLYMRLYQQFARLYYLMGDYKDAFDFLIISHQLSNDFFKDRIDMQINEQSAKYDLLVKEQRIKEEKGKSEFRLRQLILLIIITVCLSIAFVTSIFYLRMKRKGALKQKLIEAVAETEANERKRIARDLHDGLGPVLSAINHYFQAFLDAKDGEKEIIQDRLKQLLSETIDEVSRISHNISPHVLEKNGLTAALNNFIAPISSSGKIKIRFNPVFNERFDVRKELTVYRCITELLNNTIKHAGASQISLDIRGTEKMLIVTYSDDGIGFSTRSNITIGMGLNNIRNRVESFGGKWILESGHKKGTKAIIELPL